MKKGRRIQLPPDTSTIPMNKIREMCISEGGLISDEVRRIVWPKLLGIHNITESEATNYKNITLHSQYEQVEKDVDRSMWKYTSLNSDLERQYKRRQLSRIINSLLAQDTQHNLYYFQGFHDICTIFLLVCGENTAMHCCSKLTEYQLRDIMAAPSLDPILGVLKLIVPLIRCKDAKLANFICLSENNEGQFALSWVLTWFSHVIEDLTIASRLFDLFLAVHPLMPIYFATAIILYKRDVVLQTECEFSAVYKTLRELPENFATVLPIEQLVQDAIYLYKSFPPNQLVALAKVPITPSSCYVEYPYNFMKQEYNEEDNVSTLLTWTVIAASVGIASGLALYSHYKNLVG